MKSNLSLFNHPALKELLEIIEIEDNTKYTFKHLRSEERRHALEKWILENILEINNTQLTVNSKQLNLENHDFICETITHNCLDTLIESKAVQFVVTDSSYSATIYALRNRRHLNYEK